MNNSEQKDMAHHAGSSVVVRCPDREFFVKWRGDQPPEGSMAFSEFLSKYSAAVSAPARPPLYNGKKRRYVVERDPVLPNKNVLHTKWAEAMDVETRRILTGLFDRFDEHKALSDIIPIKGARMPRGTLRQLSKFSDPIPRARELKGSEDVHLLNEVLPQLRIRMRPSYCSVCGPRCFCKPGGGQYDLYEKNAARRKAAEARQKEFFREGLCPAQIERLIRSPCEGDGWLLHLLLFEPDGTPRNDAYLDTSHWFRREHPELLGLEPTPDEIQAAAYYVDTPYPREPQSVPLWKRIWDAVVAKVLEELDMAWTYCLGGEATLEESDSAYSLALELYVDQPHSSWRRFAEPQHLFHREADLAVVPSLYHGLLNRLSFSKTKILRYGSLENAQGPVVGASTTEGQFAVQLLIPPGQTFEGGDLVFFSDSEGHHEIERVVCSDYDRWTSIMFPVNTPHYVEPVTAGTLYMFMHKVALSKTVYRQIRMFSEEQVEEKVAHEASLYPDSDNIYDVQIDLKDDLPYIREPHTRMPERTGAERQAKILRLTEELGALEATISRLEGENDRMLLLLRPTGVTVGNGLAQTIEYAVRLKTRYAETLHRLETAEPSQLSSETLSELEEEFKDYKDSLTHYIAGRLHKSGFESRINRDFDRLVVAYVFEKYYENNNPENLVGVDRYMWERLSALPSVEKAVIRSEIAKTVVDDTYNTTETDFNFENRTSYSMSVVRLNGVRDEAPVTQVYEEANDDGGYDQCRLQKTRVALFLVRWRDWRCEERGN